MTASGSLADLVRRDSRRRRAGAAAGRLFELPVAGTWLARLARLPNRIPVLPVAITRLHGRLLRRSRGRLRRSWLFAAGQPVAALTTTGRRSGQPRTTAVACFVEGDDLVLAAMNLGRRNQPAWALNLMANPHARITIGGRTVDVVARRAAGEEHERLWRRWVDVQPSAAGFARIAERDIPLFVLTRRA